MLQYESMGGRNDCIYKYSDGLNSGCALPLRIPDCMLRRQRPKLRAARLLKLRTTASCFRGSPKSKKGAHGWFLCDDSVLPEHAGNGRCLFERHDGDGVMSESYEEKIAIPDERSVIGFDNIRLSQYVLPRLSTVDMSQSELAHLAFKIPSAMYNGKFSIQRELSTC
jgi:Periplasmic binding protein-like domain